MASDQDFQQAVTFVLNQEGGYVDNPRDPGGETNFGISKREYPWLDIPNLTREDAVRIYYADYWRKSGADQLPMPLALVVLDTAVNLGVGKAKEFLADSGGNVQAYLALREARYRELAQSPRYANFLNGWLARLGHLASAISAPAAGIGLAALAGLYLLARRAGWV